MQRRCEARTRSKRRCREPSLPGSRACNIKSHQLQFSVDRKSRNPLASILKISGVISLPAALISLGIWFMPEISIDPPPRSISQNPLELPFALRNSSALFSIYDVTRWCSVVSVRNSAGGSVRSFNTMRSHEWDHPIHQIRAAESSRIDCPFSIQMGPIASAEVVIGVGYAYSPLRIHRGGNYRFVMERDDVGASIWIRAPLK